MREDYKELSGTWKVTTEGDCEGRSTQILGVYTGYVDEIALHLAHRCFYSLNFTKVEAESVSLPKNKNSVSVSFNIESKTWDSIKTNGGLEEMKEVFKDRPVFISKSNYYASFTISTEEIIDERKQKREKALAKLSKEDRKILGLD